MTQETNVQCLFPASSDDEFELNLMNISDVSETYLDDASPDIEMEVDTMDPNDLCSLLNEDSDDGSSEFLSSDEGDFMFSECLNDTEINWSSDIINGQNENDKLSQTNYTTQESQIMTRSQTDILPKIKDANLSSMTEEYYRHAYNKLAISMHRSEISRAQVRLHNRSSSSRLIILANCPMPTTMMENFTALVSGNRTSLTTGLEQSRVRLREYMAQLSHTHL